MAMLDNTQLYRILKPNCFKKDEKEKRCLKVPPSVP